MSAQSRFWCITSFGDNPPNWDPLTMEFLIGQCECAPSTGRLHWQCYLILKSKRRIGGVKKLLKDDTCHLEVARGTPQENILYCSKDDTRVNGTEFSHGIVKVITKLSDEDILDRLKQTTPEEVINISPNLWRNYKTLSLLKASMYPPRQEEPYVMYFYGKGGTGKSRLARELSSLCESFYWKPAGKWWDGYSQQSCVIIDDLCLGDVEENQWKRTLDRYPYMVEIKGGYIHLNSPYIIITSNYFPLDVFKNVVGNVQAILRRISILREIV